jgi:hypothetical protein
VRRVQTSVCIVFFALSVMIHESRDGGGHNWNTNANDVTRFDKWWDWLNIGRAKFGFCVMKGFGKSLI